MKRTFIAIVILTCFLSVFGLKKHLREDEYQRGVRLFCYEPLYYKGVEGWYQDSLLLTTDLYDAMIKEVMSQSINDSTFFLKFPQANLIGALESLLDVKIDRVGYMWSTPLVRRTDFQYLVEKYSSSKDKISRKKVMDYLDDFNYEMFETYTINFGRMGPGEIGDGQLAPSQVVTKVDSVEETLKFFGNTPGWLYCANYVSATTLEQIRRSFRPLIDNAEGDSLLLDERQFGYLKFINHLYGTEVDLPDETSHPHIQHQVYQVNINELKFILESNCKVSEPIDSNLIIRYRELVDEIRFCRFNHLGYDNRQIKIKRDSLKRELRKIFFSH